MACAKQNDLSAMDSEVVSNKIPCPVCGKSYLEEYDICSICNWENDPVQLLNPDFAGGANEMSLNQARAAYRIGNKQS